MDSTETQQLQVKSGEIREMNFNKLKELKPLSKLEFRLALSLRIPNNIAFAVMVNQMKTQPWFNAKQDAINGTTLNALE